MVVVGTNGCSVSWCCCNSSLALDINVLDEERIHLVVECLVESWSTGMIPVEFVACCTSRIETPRDVAATACLLPTAPLALTLLLIDADVTTVMFLVIRKGT